MATVRALYDCDGTQESDELTFRKGDIIEQAVESQEDGWYFGILKKSGQSGLFPVNYVEMVPDKPDPSPPRRIFTESRPVSDAGSKQSARPNGSAGTVKVSGFRASHQLETPDVGRKPIIEKSDATTDQENAEPAMSVKALRARLETTTPLASKQPVQPRTQLPTQQPSKPSVKPSTPAPETSSPKQEEDTAFLKPSELRKKWAAVDAAAKHTHPQPIMPFAPKRSMTTHVTSHPSAKPEPPIKPTEVPDRPPVKPTAVPERPPVIKAAANLIPPKRPSSTLLQHPSPPVRSNTVSPISNRLSTHPTIERPEVHTPNRPVSSGYDPQPPPRVMPPRPNVQSQIYPSSTQAAPALPSRPRSAAESSQQTMPPTPPPRPTPNKRPSQAIGNAPRPTSHLPPPATAAIRKTIPIGDRMKYDAIFDDSNEQGYVALESAMDIWQGSRIGDKNLSDICELVDIRGDGWLDRKQFAAGMFLIDDRLRGFCVPTALPIGIL